MSFGIQKFSKKQDKLIYVYFCDYKKTKNFIHQINLIYDNNLKWRLIRYAKINLGDCFIVC